VTDPLFENTTLLLQADDAANGSQNNTFLDSSSNAFAITRNGNTTQGSFTPFSSQPGAWGNFFTASSNYFTVADNAALDLGTGDFTIEFWVFATVTPADFSAVLSKRDVGYNTGSWRIAYRTTTGKLTINCAQETTDYGAVLTINAWNHFAFVRSGTTLTVYANGVAGDSDATWAHNLDSAHSLLIAANTAGADGWTGYISNLRIVKGTAVYTSNFTPSPLPLTAITNTSLLTCQSNRFVDNSTNNFTITPTGTPSVQAFSPFAPQFQWTPSVIGGSGYFDGTGDWINVADSTAFTLGSGNFTVEFWVYSTTAGVRQFFAGQVNSAGANTATSFSIEKTSGNKLLGAIYSGVTQYPATSSGDIPLNAWTHIALVRDGNTLRQYINGVQDGTADVTGVTANDSSNQLSIGRLGELTSNNYFGYVSNFRFVNGTAVYTGAFTPPIAPVTTSGPASSYSSTTNVNTTFTSTNTSLLTNFTNAGIYDGTMKNNLETVGNAQVSTAVVKYGSGSMFFDGTGDYLIPNAATTDLYAFGSGDFTVEMWIYQLASGTFVLYDTRPNNTNGAYFNISSTSGQLELYANTSSLLLAGTIPLNTWTHIAASRVGTSLRGFINGTQVGSTVTNSTVFLGSSQRPVIGASGFNVTQFNFNGYIDDLRVTKGIARYTQNFIPPSVALPRQ
jgi:hypothetical protein